MGYAFTAVADDASANYYNAAGLAFLRTPCITAVYYRYLPWLSSDMHYVYFSAIYPAAKQAWGFDLIGFSPGKVDIIYDGRYLGTYTTLRITPKIIYSRIMTNKISAGFALKFPYVYMPGYVDPFGDVHFRDGIGITYALDFNILCHIEPSISCGFIIHNLGPAIRYTETGASDALPLISRLGIAYKPIQYHNFEFTISAEITKVLVGMFANEDNSIMENLKYELKEAWKGIGTEMVFYNILSLRVGYFYDYEGCRRGITFGGGVQSKGLRFDVGIDENIYDFNTTNRKFSLSYNF
jgi:hypothetical protein